MTFLTTILSSAKSVATNGIPLSDSALLFRTIVLVCATSVFLFIFLLPITPPLPTKSSFPPVELLFPPEKLYDEKSSVEKVVEDGFWRYSCQRNAVQDIVYLPPQQRESNSTNGSNSNSIEDTVQVWFPAETTTSITLLPGQPFCIRALVHPPKNHTLNDQLFDRLEPESNWDSLELIARGTNFYIPFQSPKALYDTLNNKTRYDTHLYEFEIQLWDVDVYAISGILEYRSGQWSNEGPYGNKTSEIVDLNEMEFLSRHDLSIRIIEPDTIEYYPAVHTALSNPTTEAPFMPISHAASLPLCTNGNHPGRFVPVSLIPDTLSHLPPLASASTSSTPLVFMPFNCRYKPYTHIEFAQCLNNLSTHSPNKGDIIWYGDSNSRRSLKDLASMGSWCSSITDPNLPQTKYCVCEDVREVFPYFTDIKYRYDVCEHVASFTDPVEVLENYKSSSASAFGAVTGLEVDKVRKVGLKMARIGGLTGFWCRPDVEKDVGAVFRELKEVMESGNSNNNSTKRGKFRRGLSKSQPPPLMIILGVVNWDNAFDVYERFASRLNTASEFFKSFYSSDVQKASSSSPLILRTGQYFCCNTDKTRKHTRYRTEIFNNRFTQSFQKTINTELSIWDVSLLGRMRDRRVVEFVTKNCLANHVESGMIKLENQVLMNMVCNENGVVRRKVFGR